MGKGGAEGIGDVKEEERGLGWELDVVVFTVLILLRRIGYKDKDLKVLWE